MRFEIVEAAQILRMSRAQLYIRIHKGAIRTQKDGARTYITLAELERYVRTCAGESAGHVPTAFSARPCREHVRLP